MTTTTVSTKSSPAIRTGKISKTISYYAAFVALGLTRASLGPTLPGLAEHTQTLLSEISFLFTALAHWAAFRVDWAASDDVNYPD